MFVQTSKNSATLSFFISKTIDKTGQSFAKSNLRERDQSLLLKNLIENHTEEIWLETGKDSE